MYQLYYYEARLNAEAIRYMFAYEPPNMIINRQFEDIRVAREDIQEKTNHLKGDTLPVLKWKETTWQLTQAHTIMRFLGWELKLSGSSTLEMARADELADFVDKGIFDELASAFLRNEKKDLAKLIEKLDANDEKSIAELSAAYLHNKSKDEELSPIIAKTRALCPDQFAILINLLGLDDGNEFLLGDRATWADFAVTAMLEFIDQVVYEGEMRQRYPVLGSYVWRVLHLPGVNEYVAKRKPTVLGF